MSDPRDTELEDLERQADEILERLPIEFHCDYCSRGVRRAETKLVAGVRVHSCGVDVTPWTVGAAVREVGR